MDTKNRLVNMNRLFRLQFLVLMFVTVVFVTRAFASSQTNVSAESEGANVISGWNVSNVQYRSADDPAILSAVEFDLDGPAGVVNVSVSSSNPVFFTCGNSMGTYWVCNLNPQIRIFEINELRVVVTGG